MSSKAPFKSGVYIGLGTNLGDREDNLHRAFHYLHEHPDIQVLKKTDFMETEPWGVEDQPSFLNAVCETSTQLDPFTLLRVLKEGERLLGRTPGERWGPRMIDMDILLFGEEIIDSAELVIPHPRMVHRRFVLIQLLELKKNICHPVTKRPFADYLGVD